MQPVFRRVDPMPIELGESPIWDAARQRVWFVDIPARRLHAHDPATATTSAFAMPSEVTCVALCRSGRLVLGLRSGVHLFDPASGALEFLVHPEPDRPMNRLNDGRVGPDGCLWIGSMHEAMPRRPTGALYRVTPTGEVETIRTGVCVSNGLAWSPDGRRMYFADSRSSPEGGEVFAHDFDPAAGRATNPRLFVRLTQAEGLPDGAAVDAEGFYWSAGVTAACLNRFAPDGTLAQRLALPAGAPTMPCFAGEKLDRLFVTALTREQDGRRQEGGFFAATEPLPCRGIPEWRFGEGLRAG